MAGGVSGNDDFVSDINVTPFVDVMLVLLIIFMVTAPMMTEGLDVDLPQVTAAEVLPTEDDHVLLTVKRDGAVFLDEFPTDLANLENVLRQTVAPLGKQVFLRADKDTPYGMVMEAMGKIRAAGISNLGMVAESAPVAAAAEGSVPSAAGPAAADAGAGASGTE